MHWARGAVVAGHARNLRAPTVDVLVVAFDAAGVVAFATASAAEGGRFTLLLPPVADGRTQPITLGIAGSDYLLEGGHISFGQSIVLPGHRLTPVPVSRRSIRIKISTPNLKEAPLWGDYHFANSLTAAFERIGHQAGVDTADMWYSQTADEDVVLTLRGRHRVKIDPAKINIMWLISHPDRIPDEEYADYDHIAVASDIYAAELRARGLGSVSVLHQATDATRFKAEADTPRSASCLFVGNSRREYRTMVRWCIEKDVPLDLYGGGWDGILPSEMVRGTSVANADLPGFYARHLILLNDHWDSMRTNGFLSNRLFDGSVMGTPIITDRVQGLAEVFGDTIPVADTAVRFSDIVRDCMEDPAPYLERALRAREIVLGAHTFDHRARQLGDLINQISLRK